MSTKLKYGPVHVNCNVVCAIDIRVGGVDPTTSDLLEVVFLPVNHSYKLHDKFKMFAAKIRPSWPVDKKVASLNDERLEQEFKASPLDAIGAFGLFEHWVEGLCLRNHKKIMPLVWDWTRVKPYLENWMGPENFAHYIHESVRDMLPVLNFINDRHDFWGEEVPFKHPTFGQFLVRQGIELIERNSPTADAKALIDAQRQLIRGYIPGFSKPA